MSHTQNAPGAFSHKGFVFRVLPQATNSEGSASAEGASEEKLAILRVKSTNIHDFGRLPPPLNRNFRWFAPGPLNENSRGLRPLRSNFRVYSPPQAKSLGGFSRVRPLKPPVRGGRKLSGGET